MARKAGPPKPKEPPDWEDIARREIDAMGLKPYHVAKGAAIEPSTMARFYNGQTEMNLRTFQRMCRFLGLDLVKLPSTEER